MCLYIQLFLSLVLKCTTYPSCPPSQSSVTKVLQLTALVTSMLYCLCTDRSREGLRWSMASSSRGLKRMPSSWFVVISCHQPHFLGLRYHRNAIMADALPQGSHSIPPGSDGARVFGARGKCLCCHPRQSDKFCNHGIFFRISDIGGVNQLLESPPLPSLLPRHFSPLPSHSTPVLLPPLS